MNETGINSLCRLCLNNSYYYVNIFGGQSSDDNPIFQVLNYIYDLKVSIDDGLPEYVCRDCLAMAKTFQLYKRNVHKSKSELLLIKEEMNYISVKQQMADREIKYKDKKSCSGIQMFIKQEKGDQCLANSSDNEYLTSSEEFNFQENQKGGNDTGCLLNKEMKLEEDGVQQQDFDEKTPLTTFYQGRMGVHPVDFTLPRDGNEHVEYIPHVEGRSNSRKQDSFLSDSRLDVSNLDANKYAGHENEVSEYNQDWSIRVCRVTTTNFEQPKEMHNQSKGFECDICGQKCSSKRSLNAHRLLHTGERPFRCDECGKSFRDISNLRLHQKIHGEKRFKCLECGHKFNTSSNLKRHEILHSGRKPFECDLCGKRYTQKIHLSSHKMIHSGEKPFECNDCGKRFSRKTVLVSHLMIHVGEKQFQCEECFKRFTLKHQLNAHLRVHARKKESEHSQSIIPAPQYF